MSLRRMAALGGRGAQNELASLPASFNRKYLGPMILGAILNPINSSIIAVSLVPIGQAFGAPASQTLWLVSALYIATAIGQPVVGRLVDLLGAKRLFLAGAVLAGVAGVMGTFAPNLGVLIVARVILGFGTCAGYPASMYLIRSESKRTGLASPSGVLTALAVSSQTIAVIGPTLGGVLIGIGGWRTTLAINIPLAVTSFILAEVVLPSDFGIRGKGENAKGTFRSLSLDFPGIVLFAGALISLLLFLMSPHMRDLYLVPIALIAAVGLSWWELHTDDPFLDLRLLGGNLPLIATYVRNLLAMTVSYAVLYGFTQWMQDSKHLSATEAGLLLTPMSLVAIAISGATGRNPEIRGKLLVGTSSQLAGSLLLLTLGDGSAIWLLLVVGFAFGVSRGLNSLANQNAVYYQADSARLASCSGLLRTFGYLGAITASAADGAFFGQTANTSGLHHLGVFLAAVAAASLALTAVDRSLVRVVPRRAIEKGAEDSPVSTTVVYPHTKKEKNPMPAPNTVLLVMDFQHGIVDRIGDDAVVGAAGRAVEVARERQIPVMFVRVAFRPGYPEAVEANRTFSAIARAGDAMTEHHPSTQIHAALKPLPSEPIITKRRVSAFSGSDLDVLLRSARAENLVLAGIATSGVVLSTLRQASDLDYSLTVLSDACADPDPEVHRVLLEKVFPRQALVTTTDEWAAML